MTDLMDAFDSFDAALPTYALLASFTVPGQSASDADRAVVSRLSAAEQPFHEVRVERREDDGSWKVAVRFVLASVDGQTAVAGLHETLMAAGLAPDEVWLDKQVA